MKWILDAKCGLIIIRGSRPKIPKQKRNVTVTEKITVTIAEILSWGGFSNNFQIKRLFVLLKYISLYYVASNLNFINFQIVSRLIFTPKICEKLLGFLGFLTLKSLWFWWANNLILINPCPFKKSSLKTIVPNKKLLSIFS